jgi:hypothetical protein
VSALRRDAAECRHGSLSIRPSSGASWIPRSRPTSKWVFDEAARGSLVLLISDVLAAELSAAPEEVRKVLEGLPPAAIEPVLLDDRSEGLRDAYLAAKVVGPSSAIDATHVAIATVARADAFLS